VSRSVQLSIWVVRSFATACWPVMLVVIEPSYLSEAAVAAAPTFAATPESIAWVPWGSVASAFWKTSASNVKSPSFVITMPIDDGDLPPTGADIVLVRRCTTSRVVPSPESTPAVVVVVPFVGLVVLVTAVFEP
jgi:hypothetical protein